MNKLKSIVNGHTGRAKAEAVLKRFNLKVMKQIRQGIALWDNANHI